MENQSSESSSSSAPPASWSNPSQSFDAMKSMVNISASPEESRVDYSAVGNSASSSSFAPSQEQQEQKQQEKSPPQIYQSIKSPPPPPPSAAAQIPSAPSAPGAKKKKVFHGDNISYTYPSGSKVTGSFRNGRLEGTAKYEYANGDVFFGGWHEDRKHGFGTYTYASEDGTGDVYTGEWISGKKQGRGTYKFSSGDSYTGNWNNDMISGHGTFYVAKNGNRYEGEWENSYRQGFGVLKSGNGDCYVGNWMKGKEHNLGTLFYASGKFVASNWKAGQMEGKGIMFEPDPSTTTSSGANTISGTKYLVEHVGGYNVLKEEIPEDAVVDPSYNAVNRLYQKAKAKLLRGDIGNDNNNSDPTSAAAGGGGGGGEQLQKVTTEKEMWRQKYEDLLASRGLPQQNAASETFDEEDPSEISNLESLRKLVLDARSQRDHQKLRADESKSREKDLKEKVKEIQLSLDASERKMAFFGGGGGGGAGGGEGEQQEQSQSEEQLQRRVAELEKELRNIKNPSSSSSGSQGRAGGKENETAVVKLALMEGEVLKLKGVKEELQKTRETSMQQSKQISELERVKADLQKQLNTLEQRNKLATNELEDDLREEISTKKQEIRELSKELNEAYSECDALKDKIKANIEKMRAAETKALQTGDLQAQLELLKQNRAKESAVADRKSEELEKLKSENASLQKQLASSSSSSRQNNNNNSNNFGSTLTNIPGLGGGKGPELEKVSQLEQKLEQVEKDKAEFERKERKKIKKLMNEKDEAKSKLNEIKQMFAEASLQLRSTVESHVLTFGKTSSSSSASVSAAARRESTASAIAGGGDENSSDSLVQMTSDSVISISNQNFTLDSAYSSSSSSSNSSKSNNSNNNNSSEELDKIAMNLKSLTSGVLLGFNCSVVTLGPMHSGKTTSLHSLLPLLLRDTLEPCAAKTATHEVSVSLQGIEICCDGMNDLFASSSSSSSSSSTSSSSSSSAGDASTASGVFGQPQQQQQSSHFGAVGGGGGGGGGGSGGEIKIVKDAYNSVIFQNATSLPVSNVLAFRDIASTLQQTASSNRKKQRSHILYVVNCAFRHRVTNVATFGKLLVADLAGMGDLGDQEDDIDSARYVNSSIVKLYSVIDALTTVGQTAVPYRDDPLSMALSDAFGGNSRTAIVASVPQISSSAASSMLLVEQSQQALQKAAKARDIVNAPIKRTETAEVIALRRALVAIEESAVPSNVFEIATIRES